MRLALLAGLVALVLDPMAACMPYREHFTFGASDVEPALRGTWYATWTRDGRRHNLAFRLRLAGEPHRVGTTGLVHSASACGTRTLVRSAHACITATFISLELDKLDGTAGAFEAMLYVGGYSFDSGILNLSLGEPDAEASAVISRTGDVVEVFNGPALSTGPITPVVQLEALWHVPDPF